MEDGDKIPCQAEATAWDRVKVSQESAVGSSLVPAGTGRDCKKIFLGIFLSHDKIIIRYDGLEQKGRDRIQITSPLVDDYYFRKQLPSLLHTPGSGTPPKPMCEISVLLVPDPCHRAAPWPSGPDRRVWFPCA